MEFIVVFPLTFLRHNAILVVVDKLTKISHFIRVRDTYDLIDVERVFIKEIVHLHEVLKNIISNKDLKLTSIFWTSM